jgi:hypothetical protein
MNGRRESITTMCANEFGRQRGIFLEMASQISAAFHLIKEVKERFRPKGG